MWFCQVWDTRNLFETFRLRKDNPLLHRSLEIKRYFVKNAAWKTFFFCEERRVKNVLLWRTLREKRSSLVKNAAWKTFFGEERCVIFNPAFYGSSVASLLYWTVVVCNCKSNKQLSTSPFNWKRNYNCYHNHSNKKRIIRNCNP